MNRGKNIALYIIIILLLVALFNLFQNSNSPASKEEKSFSEFLDAVENNRVSRVRITGDRITGELDTGETFASYAPEGTMGEVTRQLLESDARIEAAPLDDGVPSLLSILISWFPMLLLIGVWVFFMRQMQGGGGKAMGFGKSRARMLTEKQGRVTFEDVAGIDEAKQELEEIVEFLRDPQKFQRLGGKIPKGCLLVGPPGTGKTLLARAIAGEANVPFFSISGSDFVEMFVGVGASRVRDMFEQGKKNAPCIIFIDEIDAVGRHRGAGVGGGNDEREQTLNQLLVEMDGFEANDGVILISATNRPDVLDPALLRPGRFDRQVLVPNPDIVGREKILKVHMRKLPLAPDVDARTIARGTPGFSGADLANLCNEAALLAARKNKRVVTMTEFEEAKDKVMMGSERRSMVMTDEEKESTAYHEAGHAIVTLKMPDGDPLHKVTIIPRGRALGVTMSLPERDHLCYSRKWCEAQLAVAFGGRIAEQLIYGEDCLNTGASNDIQQATGLARRMVTEWGMSKKLGPLRYNENQEEVFLGHSVARSQNISEKTSETIDEEIKRLVEWGEKKAREILVKHPDELEAVSKALLEYETLSAEEIGAAIRGEEIRRDDSGGTRSRDANKPRASVPGTSGDKKRTRKKKPGNAPGGIGPEPQPEG